MAQAQPVPAVAPKLSEFARALCRASGDSLSGVLEVISDHEHTYIYFASGSIKFAETDAAGYTLIDELVQRELISYAQYDVLFAELSKLQGFPRYPRIDQALAASGGVAQDPIEAALASLVPRVIVRLYQATTVNCVFHTGVKLTSPPPEILISTERVTLAGIRTGYDAQRLQASLASYLELKPTLRQPPAALAPRFGFTPADLEAAKKVTGMRALRDILGPISAGNLAEAQLLYALICARQVRFNQEPQGEISSVYAVSYRGEEAAPTPSTVALLDELQRMNKDIPEDTSPGVELKQLSAAGFNPAQTSAVRPIANAVPAASPSQLPLKASAAPPSEMPMRPNATPSMLPPHLARSIMPSQRPPAPAAPPRQPTSDEISRAAYACEMGKAALESESLADAEQAFTKAADLNPLSAEHALYLAWVRYQRHPKDSNDPALWAALKRNALLVLKEDRLFAFGHFVHGHVAMHEGDFGKAELSFRVAWKLKPDDKNAERYYRLAARRNHDSSKSRR